MLIKKYNIGTAIILSLLLYVVFFPIFAFGSGMSPGQSYLYVTLPLIMLSFLFLIGYFNWKAPRGLTLFLACVSTIYCASLFSKFSFLDVPIVLAHLRYLSYLIIFIAAYSLCRYFRLGFSSITFIIYFLYISIISFIILQLTLPDTKVVSLVTNRSILHPWLGIQIGGPFIWSYSLAFILTLPLSLFLSGILYSDRKALFIFLTISTLVIFFLTQSKSAYLALMLIFTVFFILYYRMLSFGNRFLLTFSMASFFALCFYYFSKYLSHLGNIERFINSLTEGQLDASTNARYNQLSYLGDSLRENPFFGYPQDYVIIENAYGYYTYFFGVVGAFVYILLLIILFRLLLIIAFRDSRANTEFFGLKVSFAIFVASAFIFSLSNPPLDSVKTSGIFWLLLGGYFAVLRNAEQSP